MKKIFVLLLSFVFLPAGAAYAACGNLESPCRTISVSADNTVVNCIIDENPQGTCMFDLDDVLTQVNNDSAVTGANINVVDSTPMVIQAWGGNGGNGSGQYNGSGGTGGYAQTTTSVKDYNTFYFSTQVFFYTGQGGVATGTKHCGGGGGASTAVSTTDLTLNSTTRPNLAQLLVIAGGGGGGGAMDYSGFCNLGNGVPGGYGGAGGIAIATTGAAASAAGGKSNSYDGTCGSDSGGNYDGKGSGGSGGGGAWGASGVGAWGGTGGAGSGCTPTYYAKWGNSDDSTTGSYTGFSSGGGGNSATSSCDAGGGAGGGGYGGGSGGRHANADTLSCGGGGGGSYAVKSNLAGGPATRPSNPFGIIGGVALQFLIDSAEPPTVTQGLSAKSFQPGDTLSVDVFLKRVGSQTEFFMGSLLSDARTIYFVTSLDPVTLIEGDLNDPKTFRPLSDRAFIPNGVTAAFPNLFSYTFTAAEPEGTHLFFSALAHPGAFSDGSMDEGDFISIATDTFHFSAKKAPNRQQESGE